LAPRRRSLRRKEGGGSIKPHRREGENRGPAPNPVICGEDVETHQSRGEGAYCERPTKWRWNLREVEHRHTKRKTTRETRRGRAKRASRAEEQARRGTGRKKEEKQPRGRGAKRSWEKPRTGNPRV